MLALATGLVMGSYAATAGLRWTRGEPSTAGRSHCDSCLKPLAFSETLPLISYMVRRGACSRCGDRIDPVHPMGEAAGAAVLLAAALLVPWPRVILVAGLGLVLIASATIDWKTQRLPDLLTGIIALLAAVLALTGSPPRILEGVLVATVVFSLLQLLRFLSSRRSGDPGLGLGDVKLLCAVSLWLGMAIPWAVAGGALLGLLVIAILRPKDPRLPFGPMIALASFAVGLAREGVWWPMTP